MVNIDPVILHIIGPISLRWYGVAYILGILIGVWFILLLNKKDHAIPDGKVIVDDFIFFSMMGVLLGGRLGYVVFYDARYYLSNPVEILKLWNGGMSFHGGFFGMLLSMYYFCKKHKLSYYRVTDLVVCAAPIGIFFGRIANFINCELIGRTTSISWAIVSHDGIARHPSQLYEALSEGCFLWIILYFCKTFTSFGKHEGNTSYAFLVLYGIFRFVCEFFREPDAHIGKFLQFFTMGQLLSLPFILVGGVLLLRNMRVSIRKTGH